MAQVEPIAPGGSTASRIAQEHNVSRATIKRDAAVAAAINAIGAVSPETIRKLIDLLEGLHDSVEV